VLTIAAVDGDTNLNQLTRDEGPSRRADGLQCQEA
jgi:hypothetical protein